MPQYVAAHIKLLDLHIGRVVHDTFLKGSHKRTSNATLTTQPVHAADFS